MNQINADLDKGSFYLLKGSGPLFFTMLKLCDVSNEDLLRHSDGTMCRD